MKFIQLFDKYYLESKDQDSKIDTSRPERKEKKPIKRCIGKCDRKFFMRDGEPVIYCPSCDRILN